MTETVAWSVLFAIPETPHNMTQMSHYFDLSTLEKNRQEAEEKKKKVSQESPCLLSVDGEMHCFRSSKSMIGESTRKSRRKNARNDGCDRLGHFHFHYAHFFAPRRFKHYSKTDIKPISALRQILRTLHIWVHINKLRPSSCSPSGNSGRYPCLNALPRCSSPQFVFVLG